MKKNILLSLILLFGNAIVLAQTVVPEKIIGNWIHEKNNTWDYGFFEKFAVYQSGFWDYEIIDVHKKYTSVVLRKGDQRLSLKISILPDGQASIASNDEKGAKYKLNKPGFFPYATPDPTTFKTGGIKNDSVTIIGYYRHQDKLTRENAPQVKSGPFTVFVEDFLLDKSVEYYADFDSLGRFTLKFPVMGKQEVALDWGRVTKVCVVEPGEELFLFADLEDLIQTEVINSLESMQLYLARPKRILYMGANARIQNEIAHYVPSYADIDRLTILRKAMSDMEYAHTVYEIYKTRIEHLEAYIRNNPVLSDRFKEYQQAAEKYSMGFHLMQYKFNKQEQGKIKFDDGYLDFVNEKVGLYWNGEPATWIKDYSTFMRDYVSYHQDLSNHLRKDPKSGQWSSITGNIGSAVMMAEIKKSNVLTKTESEVVAQFEALEGKLNTPSKNHADSVSKSKLLKAGQKIIEDTDTILKGSAVNAVLSGLVKRELLTRQITLIDSLIQHPDLKALLIARTFCYILANERQPLHDIPLALVNEWISDSTVKEYVVRMQRHYTNRANRGLTYEAGIRNERHLKDSKDVDVLFEQLIAPYEGKVIYVDFWGTWCGPCREQMKYAGKLKKELAGKDVIFMYLANGSPEGVWNNVIKEMDLTGENVVHYRLEAEQQGMIERKFAVDSWPTYMLVNKEGKVVNNDAPRPEFAPDVIQAIESLLLEK